MEDLFKAIPGLLDQIVPDRWNSQPLVFAAWKRAIGEPLRLRTRPIEFRDGRLMIAVGDRVWKRHLEDLSPDILYRVNSILGHGVITFLEFTVDRSAVGMPKAERLTQKNERGSRISTRHPASAASKAIADEGLRECFLQFAAACSDSNARETSPE